MYRNSSGEKTDPARIIFHIAMQSAIRKTKSLQSGLGGFGNVGILTREEFIKGCDNSQKMYDIGRGRW